MASMEQPDYTYTLADITNLYGRGRVECVDHRKSNRFLSHIAVRDNQLRRRAKAWIPAEVADLIDLAVVVHEADRLSIRRGDMPCHIHVIVPVRRPDLFDDPAVRDLLRDALHWYTEDHWTFEFTRRTSYGRLAEQPCLLSDVNASRPVEVALWSGGLDCLAGLCARLLVAPDADTRYVLVETGSNSYIHTVQGRVATAIAGMVADLAEVTLVRVPIHPHNTGHRRKNELMRSRGFTFLLIGAAQALLEGQNALYVYENGLGAINLPFRPSEVGLDHARSVHPLSLLRMGALVSEVLGAPFSFCNPFIFSTKAQMCAALGSIGAHALVADTVSCDRRHRAQRMQCGHCSSCLLRRQALAVEGIPDETAYVVNMPGRPGRRDDVTHLRAM